MEKKENSITKGKIKKGKKRFPTVKDIVSHELTPIAQKYWAPGGKNLTPFSIDVVKDIYENKLFDENKQLDSRKVAVLEFSQYLENFLLPNFNEKEAIFEYLMSIVFLVNEKFRDVNYANVWSSFHLQGQQKFFTLLEMILKIPLEKEFEKRFNMIEKTQFVLFVTHCFETCDDEVVRKTALRIVHLPLWGNLSSGALNSLLSEFSELKPHWKVLEASWAEDSGKHFLEKAFIPKLFDEVLHVLGYIIPELKNDDEQTLTKKQNAIAFCERSLELFIDLLSQLHTRRFFRSYLIHSQFLVKCKFSSLFEDAEDSRLFRHLVEKLEFFENFEIDEKEGTALTDDEMILNHCMKVQKLQRVCFKYFKNDLSSVSLAPVSKIGNRKNMSDLIMNANQDILIKLCQQLGLYDSNNNSNSSNGVTSKELRIYGGLKNFLKEVLLYHFELRSSQRIQMNETPLYPTESLLWDETLVPSLHSFPDRVLALPKLNLQFLTLHDYLLRNFHLFRLEAAFEIREDLSSNILRLKPRLSNDGHTTTFTGYSPFAIPITQFSLKRIGKPLVGQTVPSTVLAECVVDLGPFRGAARREWDLIKPHDVLFLLTIKAPKALVNEDADMDMSAESDQFESWEEFNALRLGVKHIRGCEVTQIIDQTQSIVGERDKKKGQVKLPSGDIRTFRILLDAAQYQIDMKEAMERKEEEEGGEGLDIYTSFNLLMRRKPEENNFKAVIHTIRELTNEAREVPEWLHDVFLGYGDPASAHYSKMETKIGQFYFRDTFLSLEHLKEAFPDYDIVCKGNEPPFKISFKEEEVENLSQITMENAKKENEKTDSKTTKEKKRKNRSNSDVDKVEDVKQKKNKKQKVEKKVPVPKLTVKEINAMKVVELKKELKERSLSQAGKKNILIERLIEAVESETAEMKEEEEEKEEEKEEEEKEEEKEKGEEKEEEDVEMKEETKDEVKEEKKSFIKPSLIVKSYIPPAASPYASHIPRRNEIRFTSRQVEAIKSGLNPGLSIIVGPPGSGKTDVAVQILSELYHNFPKQRTLIITHSNHALNDIFEKIMQRDIDERYLLRLGHGELNLTSDKDFSKYGRVNYMLSRRLELLQEVGKLALSMGFNDDVSYTCEHAAHFFLHTIVSEWEKCQLGLRNLRIEEQKKNEKKEIENNNFEEFFVKNYPFTNYFKNINFDGKTVDENLEKAAAGFRYLEHMFEELEETRPFELLRTYRDRGNYLVTKQAKVIAMTCTHAAINRKAFIDLGFQYDNLIIEESAQILEIETAIPMLLQSKDKEFGCRLKRVIMLGDHHQLPPVVQNVSFQKYSHMDQSMFTRFLRLGIPHIQLNAQGRMRPSLASLWSWRYKGLMNLPCVLPQQTIPQWDPRFGVPNPGFAHEYQFVNVDDFRGKGEITPQPYFYQNLGEAEYVVHTYMYMRLQGYPAQSISIITTYNGQRCLINDILSQRCANDPLYGLPAKVSTVDKFQGQQNDYILLSLVRTKAPGHIRDIRRLVVAMSRARLGLYIFGRLSLFMNCLEFSPIFNILMRNPTKLALTSGNTEKPEVKYIDDLVQFGYTVRLYYQEIQKQYDLYEKRVQEFEMKRKEEKEKKEKEMKRLEDEKKLEAEDQRIEKESQEAGKKERIAEEQMEKLIDNEEEEKKDAEKKIE